MRPLFAAMILLMASTLYSVPKEYLLLIGDCTLPIDPIKDEYKINSSVFACQKGDGQSDLLYIPNKTIGNFNRFNLRGSGHYGTTHALFYEVYFEQMDGTSKTELAFKRKLTIDTASYQFGNPATDVLRVIVGHQKPAFGINHFPALGFNQLLDPRYLWGSPQPGMNLIFDTQNALQFELGWLASENYPILKRKPRDHWITARMMYDFALNGSTRSIFSIMAKKTGEKRLGAGIISRGPKLNSFQVEWIRIYTSLTGSLEGITKDTFNESGGLKTSYTQLIRLAYEDPPDQSIRTSILYDDLSFQYRLFGIGATFNLPINLITTRFLIAFRQDVTSKKQHRWLFGAGVGFHL